MENLTSIYRRERPLPQEEVQPREDTHGPSKQLEETPLVPVEWDPSDTRRESKRTDIEPELKPPRKSNPHEAKAMCQAYLNH